MGAGGYVPPPHHLKYLGELSLPPPQVMRVGELALSRIGMENGPCTSPGQKRGAGPDGKSQP